MTKVRFFIVNVLRMHRFKEERNKKKIKTEICFFILFYFSLMEFRKEEEELLFSEHNEFNFESKLIRNDSKNM